MPLSKDSSKLRVVHHDPERERRIKIILVVGFVLLGVGAYWFGGSKANNQNQRLESRNLSLSERAGLLQKENEVLHQRVAILESSSKIDRETVNSVRKLVRQLQDEKDEISRELTFYKNIMAPEDLSKGVRVSGFDLERGAEPGVYRFRLIISQTVRNNPFRRGSVSVSVSGQKDNKPVTVSLLRQAGYDDDSAPLGFRYFQAIPGDRGFLEFELPEGFEPAMIHVNGSIEQGPVRKIEKNYEWKKELASGASARVAPLSISNRRKV